MKRLSALLLVVVVVLAGCTGSGGGPTDDPAPTPDGDIPGVSASGVDADALVTAHVDALADRSYRLDVEQRIGNGGLEIDAKVAAGRVPALIDISSATADRVTYVSDDGGFELRRASGDRTVRRIDANASTAPTGATYIRRVLGDANFSYDGTVRHEGKQLHRLRADLDDLTRQFEDANVTDFDGSLLVDESGLVHSITYRLTVQRGGSQSTLLVDMSLWRLGQTTVEEPAWIDEVGDDPNVTTRTLSNASLGTTLSVSGPPENVTTVTLQNASRAFYNTDIVSEARVSSLASVSANASVSLADLRMAYDAGAVPGGDASELFVFVYHPEYQTFLPMETSFDPANQTVQATTIDPETNVTVDGQRQTPTLDGLDDGEYVFVVMHGGTYWDAYEEQANE